MKATMAFLALAVFAAAVQAQQPAVTTVQPNTEPPLEVTAARQPWAAFQDWYCQERLSPDQFASAIFGRMNHLGKKGWELVSFVPAGFPGRNCFVASFKAPTKKP